MAWDHFPAYNAAVLARVLAEAHAEPLETDVEAPLSPLQDPNAPITPTTLNPNNAGESAHDSTAYVVDLDEGEGLFYTAEV